MPERLQQTLEAVSNDCVVVDITLLNLLHCTNCCYSLGIASSGVCVKHYIHFTFAQLGELLLQSLFAL